MLVDDKHYGRKKKKYLVSTPKAGWGFIWIGCTEKPKFRS